MILRWRVGLGIGGLWVGMTMDTGMNMSQGRCYFLKTERLGFGRWAKEDLALASALWGDPKVTGLLGGPFTADQVAERLAKEIVSMAACNVQYWPIFLLENGEHVGCAGLRPYQVEVGIYELGFHLRREYWGRGLAQEGALAVVHFGFETLGVKALFAGHHPANAASRRILTKLGFEYVRDEYYPPTGLEHPSYRLIQKD